MTRVGTLALLFAALALAGCKKKAEAPAYVTAPVERGRIVGRVTATGTLSALVTVQVGTQVSGRVAQLFVDFNSTVEKGQVLAKIDPQLFQASLAQAKANEVAAEGNLAKAQAQAADAKLIYQRDQQLFEKKLIAQADLDTARATWQANEAGVKAAQGSVQQSKASRELAEVNLAYTTIVSPIDGTVISRAVDVGQTVAASLQAPTLFTIAQDLAKMQVDTNVAEADVGKLQPGMAATFTVDAYPGEHFRGTIRQIRNAPLTVQNVVTYDAVIDVANPDLKLRPGMTANVTFIYATANDALKIPNAALRWKPEGAPAGRGNRRGAADGGAVARGQGQFSPPRPAPGVDGGAGQAKTVYALRGDQPAPVQIQVGITDGTSTEVLSGGLQEGDAVIVDNSGGGAGASKPARFRF